MYSEETVMQKLAEALGVDQGCLQKDTTSLDVEAWDSLGTMNILSWLDSEFGIKLSPNETIKLQSVRSILDLLSAAGKLS